MLGQFLSVHVVLLYFAYHFIIDVQAAKPGAIACVEYPKLHVHDVRIDGCTKEPCEIRKGESLPFELDFSFENSTEWVDRVYHFAYANYYAVPPALNAESISYATCDNDTMSFYCPISQNVTYTLKSSLFIDERAVCTYRCDDLGPDGTGLRDTWWTVGIYNTQRKSGWAECRFLIPLNITSGMMSQ